MGSGGLVAGLDVDARELERLAERFQRLIERTENLRPALRLLEDVVEDARKEQFRTGAGWAALKRSTVARKGNNKKLIDSGALRDSIVNHPRVKYTNNTLDMSVSLTQHPEAKYLKSGARGMRKRDPARVNVDKVKSDAREVLLEYFIENSGFGS